MAQEMCNISLWPLTQSKTDPIVRNGGVLSYGFTRSVTLHWTLPVLLYTFIYRIVIIQLSGS